MSMTYLGLGIPRTREIEFTVDFTDAAGNEVFHAVKTPREFRLTLAEGERWPDDCKRGRHVDLDISLGDEVQTWSGIVKYRRLNVCVLLLDQQ